MSKHNNTLQQLMLTDCELSNESITCLLRSIPEMKSLTMLSTDGLQRIRIRQRMRWIRLAKHSVMHRNDELEAIHLPSHDGKTMVTPQREKEFYFKATY
jgi:hypothetical protein